MGESGIVLLGYTSTIDAARIISILTAYVRDKKVLKEHIQKLLTLYREYESLTVVSVLSIF